MGSIPYPGAFNLFELCDPLDLGEHQYEVFTGRGDEVEHCVIYTCKAGFLDIAHVRETMDWARYAQYRVERELRAGHTRFVVQTSVPSWLYVTVAYPGYWKDLDRQERARITHELSIVMGERLAYLMGIWHEAVTWMGYKSTAVVPEDRSAFTYEDIMSNMVGVMVAGTALRDTKHGYDDAATIALRQVIDELGPVSMSQAYDAIALVEGKWWKDGDSLKRYLDVGLDDDTIEPWLVPGLNACGARTPASYSLPSMADISGLDLSNFYTVSIEPRIDEASWLKGVFGHTPGQIRYVSPSSIRVFGYTPGRLDVKTDLPRVMAKIREEMAATMGPELDNPAAAPTAE